MLQKTDNRKSGHDSVHAETPYRSAEERRAQGKALRKPVPREEHGGWKPPKGRADPIERLIKSNEGRLPELVPIRFGRMLQSPFAFFAVQPRLWRLIWLPRRSPDQRYRLVAMRIC